MSLLVCIICFILLALMSPLALAGPDCLKKPNHPSCTGDGGGGFETRDLPANALFLQVAGDAVMSDDLAAPDPYMDGEERVSSFIGRREGQFVLSTSNKATSGRMLCVYGDFSNDNCADFSGCRVAQMTSARVQYGGADLRLLKIGQEVTSPLSLNLYDNRQNLWHVLYGGVRVEAVATDGDHNPTAWEIDTGCDGCSSADVSQIIDNQYVDAIDCGSFSLPFHLSVVLQ